MLTCRDLIQFLDDYVANVLTHPARTDFDAHLAICPPCVDYLRTYRDCIDLSKAALADPNAPPPPCVPEQLVAAVVSAIRAAGANPHLPARE